MLADRANLRSLGSYYDMSAVTALPDGNAALLKHLHGLHVAQKLAVALLVHLLNDSYATELLSDIIRQGPDQPEHETPHQQLHEPCGHT